MNVVLNANYAPEDLLRMGDGPRYELVNGRLVEKAMSLAAARVGSRLNGLLGAFADAQNLGLVFDSNAGYQAFPHEPRRVRYPDLSFIRRERVPVEGMSRGHCRVAPDLAVEVVSPNDLAPEIDARVKDYLRAGTPLVWVIYPDTRSVDVFRGDGSGGWHLEDQELSGEDVLPGFACRVAELFRGLPTHPEGEPPPAD